MRIVFVGASRRAVMAARMLIDRGHEVVIVEKDREYLDSISEELDCGYVHGDGGDPKVLEETGPEETDILFCLSDDDKANILASLIGRSLGFGRVIPGISEPRLKDVCDELGLEDTIIPDQTIARYLADMSEGIGVVELATALRAEARFFTFKVGEKDAGTVADLNLPQEARVVCFYRGDEFSHADPDTRLEPDDEAVILTHRKHIKALRERWRPRQARRSQQQGSQE